MLRTTLTVMRVEMEGTSSAVTSAPAPSTSTAGEFTTPRRVSFGLIEQGVLESLPPYHVKLFSCTMG